MMRNKMKKKLLLNKRSVASLEKFSLVRILGGFQAALPLTQPPCVTGDLPGEDPDSAECISAICSAGGGRTWKPVI